MRGLDVKDIDKIKTLIEFDDNYTAPIHGFQNAVDYYTKCSSIHLLRNIQIPTLLVSAQNDPFLTESCFPEVAMRGHAFVKFEKPVFGGHVGFSQFNENGLYWSEVRALSFLKSFI